MACSTTASRTSTSWMRGSPTRFLGLTDGSDARTTEDGICHAVPLQRDGGGHPADARRVHRHAEGGGRATARGDPRRPRRQAGADGPGRGRSGLGRVLSGGAGAGGLLRPQDEAPPIRAEPARHEHDVRAVDGRAVGHRRPRVPVAGGPARVLRQDPRVVRRTMPTTARADPSHGGALLYEAPSSTSRFRRCRTFADYDLGLSHRTHFQTFNVFVGYGRRPSPR